VAKGTPGKLGKYHIVERLATGDLAEVFKARVKGVGGFQRYFAVKRIQPHLARVPAYVELLEEEARIAGLLNHGNIVQLLDLGRDDNGLFLVMEFVDGWDLDTILHAAREADRPLPIPHALWIAIHLLKALEYAHQREVIRDGKAVDIRFVHRDVSPSNVLLSRQGDVKLTDFGIARASLKMMQTHPDLVARRFDYLSPEQARSGDITQSVDIYGVGLLLYECLTLLHPFRRGGDLETLEAIRDGEFMPLRDVRPDVSSTLARIVSSALSTDPEARPEHARSFRDLLEREMAKWQESFSEQDLVEWVVELIGEEAAPADVLPEPTVPDT